MKDLVLAIFGATGDLSYRKLLPALYNLYQRGELDASVTILALGRRDWDRDDYIAEIKPWVEQFARLPYTEDAFAQFTEHIDYHRMEFTVHADYLGLFSRFDDLSNAATTPPNYIFYYAVSPSFFDIITKGLTETGCIQGNNKVIVEKPFGDNLEDAQQIAERLADAFGAHNVYHIDHYLGKEMVQNLSALRFRNEIFRGVWNNRHIEQVQISAFEAVGMEGRGAYYNEAGAMKDMVQNHLFQVLSIFAMEEPADLFDETALNRAQTRVIEDLVPITADTVNDALVMAQYEGFLEEADIPSDSTTESYAALTLHIANERWRGVPFYVRTGKHLSRRETVLVVHFRPTHPYDTGNRLVFRIQPEEGVSLYFNLRRSGSDHEIDEVSMDFYQKSRKAWQNSPEAYERLLEACYQGARDLFSPWSMITASWSFINTLLDGWHDAGHPLATYAPGSDGPREAEELLKRHGHRWIDTAPDNIEPKDA